MTTFKARRLTLALVLPLLLLAVGCDSTDATQRVLPPPGPLVEGEFTIRSAEGTFKAFGIIDDYGLHEEDFFPSGPLHMLSHLSGRKFLEGEKGTIMIDFYVVLSATDSGTNTLAAKGGFQIVDGSGAYAGLQGSGEIDRQVADDAAPAELTNVLKGEAQFAQ